MQDPFRQRERCKIRRRLRRDDRIIPVDSGHRRYAMWRYTMWRYAIDAGRFRSKLAQSVLERQTGRTSEIRYAPPCLRTTTNPCASASPGQLPQTGPVPALQGWLWRTSDVRLTRQKDRDTGSLDHHRIRGVDNAQQKHRPPAATIRLALLGSALSVPAWADAVLSISPSSAAVLSGSPLNVDVVISGLGLPPEVGSFDLGVSYDPTLLTPTGVTFGNFLGDPSVFQALTMSNLSFAPNIVEAAEVSLLSTAALDALQPASFTLFTIDFSAIGNGTANLQYPGGPIDDGNGVLLFGTKTISAVPEPRSLLLVGSALCLLAILNSLLLRCRRNVTFTNRSGPEEPL